MRVITIVLLLLTTQLDACHKDTGKPDETQAGSKATPGFDLSASASSVELFQGNAVQTALFLSWTPDQRLSDPSTIYSVQFRSDDNEFDDSYIERTGKIQAALSVEELNRATCRFLPPGTAGFFAFRIKAELADLSIIYSSIIGVRIKSYVPFTAFTTASQALKVPCNEQNWVLADAPLLVDRHGSRVFEGMLNFLRPQVQFLLLKGDQWATGTTYYHTSGTKFGLNGIFFTAPAAPGNFYLRANYNDTTLTLDKISVVEVVGSAVAAKEAAILQLDSTTGYWHTKINLKQGAFRIAAAQQDHLSFGAEIQNGYLVPDLAATDFEITVNGYYEIWFDLSTAGNYHCTVVRKGPLVGGLDKNG